MSLDEAVRFLVESHAWVTITVLFAAAAIEYIFPPFPGDTVTLAGAVLVTGWGFPVLAVIVPVVAGGLAGSAVDFGIGRMLARSMARKESPGPIMRLGIVRKALEGAGRASARFSRHGEAFIVVNRFLPGIRAFLFVAAGMAGMRFGRVMLFAAVSNILWNLLLLAAGMALGANLDRIESLFRSYGIVAWTIVGLVAAAWLVRRTLLKRRQARDQGKTPPF